MYGNKSHKKVKNSWKQTGKNYHGVLSNHPREVKLLETLGTHIDAITSMKTDVSKQQRLLKFTSLDKQRKALVEAKEIAAIRLKEANKWKDNEPKHKAFREAMEFVAELLENNITVIEAAATQSTAPSSLDEVAEEADEAA